MKKKTRVVKFNMSHNQGKPRPYLLEEYSVRSRQRIEQNFQRLSAQDKPVTSNTQNIPHHLEAEHDISDDLLEVDFLQMDTRNVVPQEDENICDKSGNTSEENDWEHHESQDEDEYFSSSEEEDIASEENSENPIGPEETSTAKEDRCLYDGARITVAESLLAIMTVFLKHHLTGACLADLLTLIELHCPVPNLCKKSMYLFKKYFENIRTPLRRHFYCSNCYSLLNDQRTCTECPAGTEVCYFLQISILEQLQKLYNRFDFFHKLQARFNRVKKFPNNYEDIYDGKIYQVLSKPGNVLSNPDNLSFTWNTDGVAMFKSSNMQIWPFFLSINELPFNERTKKENLILSGLWFGPKKPFPPAFLEPISSDLTQLKQGVDFDIPHLGCVIKVQAVVICGTCDLPAKALFLNMKQYNGEYGCQKCKIRGQQYEQTSIRVYPFERHLDNRTQPETDESAQKALETGTAVHGVKGPSAISQFLPNYIRCTAVDVMHAVFLGVVKALLILWFSPSLKDRTWSLAASVKIVDKYICSIIPPDFVVRLPRSLSENLHYLKASELKAWFFYYSSPILKIIMPTAYFQHYLLLVTAIHLLNQSSISEGMIHQAEELLIDFVARFQDLYDERYMTANLHQLLHLAETVRDFGPLWMTSCLAFENANGQLKSLTTGTRFSGLQIGTGLSYFVAIPELLENLDPDHIVHIFCNKVNEPKKKYKSFCISGKLFAIGAMKTEDEIPGVVLDLLEAESIEGSNLGIFFRFMRSGILYTSQMYQRCKKTNSTCAKYTTINGRTKFGIIKCFIRVSACECTSYCPKECNAKYVAVLSPCTVVPEFYQGLHRSAARFYRYTVTDNLVVVDVTSLCCVCFNIKDPQGSMYIIEPVNLIELE